MKYILEKLRKLKSYIMYKLIKSNFLINKEIIVFKQGEKIIDFNEFKDSLVYKDENWNYIINLDEYLKSIHNKNKIMIEDNEIENKKYIIKNDNLIINTGKIDYNWVCFFLEQKEEKNFIFEYKLEIKSEFEEIQIAFNYENLGTRYRFMIRNNEMGVFECVYRGDFYNELFKKKIKLKFNKDYVIKVVVLNNNFIFYIDNNVIFSIKEKRRLANGGKIGLIFYNYTDKNNVNCIIKDVNVYKVYSKNNNIK